MASPRPGDFHASVAILGLLIRQADTVAGLGVRLHAEHPSGRWARNSVHNCLPTLLAKDLIRVARPGRERSLDRYEPTPAGAAHFREWVNQPAAAPPAQRDALRAKLKYLDAEEQLQSAIEDILRQESVCAREGEAAAARYRAARLRGLVPCAEEGDWRARVQRALMIDEVKLWHERLRGLRRLRADLECPGRGGQAPGSGSRVDRVHGI